MAKKRKTKIYATQRAKDAIEFARYAKERGILSKQTKLHGGRYISRGVLAKIKKYNDVISAGYVARKVPKKQLEAAKAAGMVTVGNKVVTPPGNRYAARIKRGENIGVRPIRNNFVEVVRLPWTVRDLRDFVRRAQENPEVFNDMKMPDELFVFKFFGNTSYRPYITIQDLVEELIKYKAVIEIMDGDLKRIAEEEGGVEAIELLRVNPDRVRDVIPSRQERYTSWVRRREYRPPSERVQMKRAQRKAKDRAKMSPEQREKYNAKGRARAAKSKANRKRFTI